MVLSDSPAIERGVGHTPYQLYCFCRAIPRGARTWGEEVMERCGQTETRRRGNWGSGDLVS